MAFSNNKFFSDDVVPSVILITGCAGFIGSNLAKSILGTYPGVKVIGVDNYSTGSPTNVLDLMNYDNFDFYSCNLASTSQVEELKEKIDFSEIGLCYHFAASIGVKLIQEEPHKSLKNSMAITNNLIDIFDTYNIRVIYGSTSEVYGETKHKLLGSSEADKLEIQPTQFPRGSYACSKLFTENLLRSYTFETTVVRFFNVIGPEQKPDFGHVIPNFVQNVKTGQPLVVHDDGSSVRSYCHIDDAVQMLMLLMHNNFEYSPIYNIGNTTNTISSLDLACLVAEIYAYHSFGDSLSDEQAIEKYIEFVNFSNIYSKGVQIHTRFPDTTLIDRLYFQITGTSMHKKPIMGVLDNMLKEL